MKKIILITIIAKRMLRASLIAQNSIWNSSGVYLGQKPPGDTRVLFAPGRLANTGYWVGGRVAFTNDGKQFLYGTNTTWLLRF